jgi:hypothetical protein
MSTCLDDARVQIVADGEATAAELNHLAGCAPCRARVDAARGAVANFAHAMSGVSVPPMLGSRVTAAVSRAAAERAGATTLRTSTRARPAWLVAGGVAAAAVIAIVFIVWPAVDSGTRVNAAEILNRSLQTLAVEGTELLKYELSIDAPGTAVADTGTFVIEQLIDHESGRWRFSRFAPDGTLLNGIAEDPTNHARDAVMRLEGQTFRFHFAVAADQRVPLWDLQRRYAEMMIRLVQASGARVVTTEQGADGMRYVVDLPATERPAVPAPFDLHQARVVIDASDYHVVEFTAAGAVMGEPVSIGYRLIQRSVWGSAPAGADFTLGPRDADAIELQGDGTRELPRDFLTLLLRQLAVSYQLPGARYP